MAAPLELIGKLVVGQVPAGVLHQGHRDAGVDRVLGVRASHRLVLKVGCRVLLNVRIFFTIVDRVNVRG